MQNKPHARKRCGAKTRSGKPCKNGAMSNGRCRMHGGKSTGAPPEKMNGNQNSKKHGFFSRYIPKDTLELMGMIEKANPIDLLWDQIQIQYAAIIRAQQIMFVTDKGEMIKELKKEKVQQEITGENEDGEAQTTPTYVEQEYEFQFSWDRHATFLNAQSRAMSELRNMIKQYDELLKTDLATEEQKARIELLKSKVPNQDTANMNEQVIALADLINNPANDRVIDDD